MPDMRFTCKMCGECCRRYMIPVTDSDIRRIARFVNQDPSDFLTFIKPHESVASTYFYAPKIDLGDGPRMVLVLREDSRGCAFCKGNKCVIHDVKPLICRPFPFGYSMEAGKMVEVTISDDARDFCKGIGKGSQESDVGELTRTVLAMEAEQESFVKKIEDWNRSKSTIRTVKPRKRDLLKFLLG